MWLNNARLAAFTFIYIYICVCIYIVCIMKPKIIKLKKKCVCVHTYVYMYIYIHIYVQYICTYIHRPVNMHVAIATPHNTHGGNIRTRRARSHKSFTTQVFFEKCFAYKQPTWIWQHIDQSCITRKSGESSGRTARGAAGGGGWVEACSTLSTRRCRTLEWSRFLHSSNGHDAPCHVCMWGPST